MIRDINVRVNTTKILKGLIGINPCDVGFVKGFLDITPKAKVTHEKKKINQNLSKYKNIVLQRILPIKF